MSNPSQDGQLNLVVVSAGTSDPSSTRLLADRTAQRVAALAEVRGATVTTRVIDLRELATDVTTALTTTRFSGLSSGELLIFFLPNGPG